MADSRYVLMHKNTPVADLQLDTDTGVIRSVGHVYNALHVPVGIPVKKGVIDRSALNTWWTGRAIPASRDRIRDALRELELASTQLLLDKCLGLSLSDQYWICPTSSGVRWEEVNFFQNAFSFAASETWAFTLQQIRICTVTLQTVSLSYIGRRFVTEGYQIVVDLICKSSASFQ